MADATNEDPSRQKGTAKRPPWLLAALVVALLFGAGSWNEGCSRIELYRGSQSVDMVVDARVQDEAAREAITKMYERFGAIADDTRSIVLPFAIATFVLGAALLALSARGLAGRTNTRSALVQVVAVQAILAAASFAVTRPYREAELAWNALDSTAVQRATVQDEVTLRQRTAMIEGARRYSAPVGIVLRMLGSGLVLLALTRQRSREFFEAAGARVPEQ